MDSISVEFMLSSSIKHVELDPRFFDWFGLVGYRWFYNWNRF